MEGSERVKPLVSPVQEYRWIGLAYLVAGTAFGVVAILVGSLPQALFSLAFFGISFGVTMHFVVVRRGAAAAVESPSPPPTSEREERSATVRRVVRDVALTSGAMAIVVLVVGRATFAGGAFLGMGGALLATSWWLERWQIEKSALILREPRNRWGGGGIADRRDFYVVEIAPSVKA